MIPVQWRLWAALACLLAAFGGVAYVRHLQTESARLRASLAASQAQAKNNAEAVTQVDRFVRTETIIRERSDHAVQAVRIAPGAETPIPDAVRDAWATGIGRMRDGSTDGDADSAGDVSR